MDRNVTRDQSPLVLSPLGRIGLRVVADGRLVNWMDRPTDKSRPIHRPEGSDRTKQIFTTEEELQLLRWMTAAEADELGGREVFEQLEALLPSHSWYSYRSKWSSKIMQNKPRAELSVERPFPGLMSPSSNPVINDPLTPHITASKDQSLFEYPLARSQTNFRVDYQKNMNRLVGADTEDGFKSWLTQDGFLDAYIEFVQHMNDGETPLTGTSTHGPKVERAQAALSAPRSKYTAINVDKTAWTIEDHAIRFMVQIVKRVWSNYTTQPELQVCCERAVTLLAWVRYIHRRSTGVGRAVQRAANYKARYLKFLDQHTRRRLQDIQTVDPSMLPTSVHDVQLLDSLKDLKLQQIQMKAQTEFPSASLEHLVDGLKQSRLQHIQEALQTDPTSCSNDTAVFSGASDSPTGQILIDEADSTTSDDSSVSGIGSTSNLERTFSHELIASEEYVPLEQNPDQTDTPIRVPSGLESVEGSPTPGSHALPQLREPHMPSAADRYRTIPVPIYPCLVAPRRRQVKGVMLLTEDALITWENSYSDLMSRWGRSPSAEDPCLLVSERWRRVAPLDMLDNFQPPDDREPEGEHARHKYTYMDISTSWARIAAWFNKDTWPRRGVDLDVYLSSYQDGPYEEMHGSHRCHHGLCLNSHHICWESREDNSSRSKCKAFAIRVRRHNVPMPRHCRDHHPPCLLQNTALTLHECLSIQFNILRAAIGRAPDLDYPRPDGHRYSTFERNLPLQFETEDGGLSIASTDLTQPRTSISANPASREYNFSCAFCRNHNAWRKIEAYWSHVKLRHEDVPQVRRVAEVKRTTGEYCQFLRQRGYDYSRNNPRIWNMMQQAIAHTFDWETFNGWILHEDPLHSARPAR